MKKQDYIKFKLKQMTGENKPMDQKLAIAYSYAKKKGLS